MSLQLSFCEDRDMVDVFAVISASFGHEHPYIESLFPDHDQPLGRQRGGERLLNIKHTDPNTTFLKVVDINSKQIVGVAKWIVYNGVLPEESVPDGPFWANQDEKELAQDMFRGYNVPRMKAIRESGGNLVSMDVLTVAPQHQKRGAGRMLLRWGTAIADDMGVETVVEASNQGRHLYESEGFKFLERYIAPLPEKWAGRNRQEFNWMVRPAKKKEIKPQQ